MNNHACKWNQTCWLSSMCSSGVLYAHLRPSGQVLCRAWLCFNDHGTNILVLPDCRGQQYNAQINRHGETQAMRHSDHTAIEVMHLTSLIQMIILGQMTDRSLYTVSAKSVIILKVHAQYETSTRVLGSVTTGGQLIRHRNRKCKDSYSG